MGIHRWLIVCTCVAACHTEPLHRGVASIWRDGSPHTSKTVRIAPGAAVEVLDWGGRAWTPPGVPGGVGQHTPRIGRLRTRVNRPLSRLRHHSSDVWPFKRAAGHRRRDSGRGSSRCLGFASAPAGDPRWTFHRRRRTDRLWRDIPRSLRRPGVPRAPSDRSGQDTTLARELERLDRPACIARLGSRRTPPHSPRSRPIMRGTRSGAYLRQRCGR